jgi:hypothetical protein
MNALAAATDRRGRLSYPEARVAGASRPRCLALWALGLVAAAAGRLPAGWGDHLPPITMPPADGPTLSLSAQPAAPYGVFAPGEAVTWSVSASSTIPALEGWSFWAADRSAAFAQVRARPVPHIAVSMGNGGLWALDTKPVRVEPGQVWTFTAVIARRDTPAFPSGSGALGVFALDEKGSVVEWHLGRADDTGTFAWKRRSVTVKVPAGVAALEPRFHGQDGGQYFIAAASFDSGDRPAELPVPTTGVPPVDGSDLPKVAYRIVDAYGRQLAAGTFGLAEDVRFTPRQPGFFELHVFAKPGARGAAPDAISSAIVAPAPPGVTPGSNPFGVQASPDELIARLGFSWTRPLYYDIVSGSHAKLPTDLSAYADAWETKAREGLPPYEINTIEVWNEPEGELGPLGKDWTISQFVDFVRATREGARRGNPDAKIAVNFINVLWDRSSTYRDFVRAGGGPLHDILTIHPYSMHLYNEPIRPDSPEEDMLLEFVASIKELMRQEGVGEKAIWSTEFGWPTRPGYPWSTTELDQARYIVRSSILQLAAGVERVNPFRMTNVPFWGPMDSSFGMLRDDGAPKPSLAAYATLAQTVGDRPYLGRFDLGTNVGAFLFGRAESGCVLALWRYGGSTALSIPLPTSRCRLVRLFGEVSEVKGRSFSGQVGPSPVYLVLDASPARVAEAMGRPLLTGQPVGVFDVGRASKLQWKIPVVVAPPRVDGDLRDWSGPEIVLPDAKRRWEGAARVCVDAQNLYVAVAARGRGIVAVNTHPPDRVWDGDGFELFLSTEPDGRLMRASRDVDRRIIFVPGSRGRGAAAMDVWSAEPGPIPGSRVAVRVVQGGYNLEASVPLAFFGPVEKLRAGGRLAFDVALNIGNGERQIAHLAQHGGAAWMTSYVWGTATVGGEWQGP